MGEEHESPDEHPERREEEHLLADEDLPRDEEAQDDAVADPARVVLGQAQHAVEDDGHEELGDEVRVAVRVRDEPGREAGEARADGGGERVDGQAPPEQPEPGGGREGEAEELDEDEGHLRAGEQGEGGQGDAEPEDRGVGHEVDALGEVLEVAEQGVRERREVVRRRSEVPLERLLVLHALATGGR